MEYFSINAFLLGMLLFSCLYLSNIVYSLICFIWKIKIVEFGIFANAWFSLYNENILGTKFILGWFPMSSWIKPLGKNANEEERQKISQNELPYAFFNKPKYLKTVFRLVPWFIEFITLITAIILLSDSSVISEMKEIVGYVLEVFKTMFSDNKENQQFVTATKEMIDGKNVVVFAFAMLVLLTRLFALITSITYWFSIDDNKITKIQKILGFLDYILMIWLFWKILKFVFHFFTFSQILIYILSYFLGMFSIGLLFFFTTLFMVKNIDQNLNDNKLK